jgi:cystathionine beta-lyase/cystathionine gamma-synthase
VSNDVYKIFESVRRRTSGLTFSYVKDFSEETLKLVKQENTRLIWSESLKRPSFRVPDFESITKFAKANELISVCDNTLATPSLFNPIQAGFDIVIHDAKGYLNGTMDVEGGCVVVAKGQEFIREKLGFLQRVLGSVLSLDEQKKIITGLINLEERIEQQSRNAHQIAEFLFSDDTVSGVNHLGLKSHPDFEYASKTLDGFGAVFSIALAATDKAILDFQEKLNLFSLSETVGGPSSTIWHPASILYGSVPDEIKKLLGAENNYFQLSIGLENIEDIQGDLQQALSA